MLLQATTGSAINIWAVLIGVLTGLITTFVSHYFQFRMEKQKIQLQIQKDRNQEFKDQIANTIQAIMVMIHEISWVSWEASKGKAESKDAYLKSYNEEAKTNLVELTKHLGIIASRDLDVYKKLYDITQEVYALDVELANLLVELIDGKAKPEDFMEVKKKSNDLNESVPKEFADILKSVNRMRLS